ncbi:hypothetical protein D1B33_00585 [Lysinibacillus yapensis]|uniref:Uncharacterized protein n=1 Tax=Ureibacillus yapensis TaxID=2304605 RepID=A0A396SDH8_9BACL|nr:hypothetical protein [Lysinibacillus yapensis]RHW39374.1 hypothetical protein D1B33_00585 [Lysinibacillus yapensis]
MTIVPKLEMQVLTLAHFEWTCSNRDVFLQIGIIELFSYISVHRNVFAKSFAVASQLSGVLPVMVAILFRKTI